MKIRFCQKTCFCRRSPHQSSSTCEQFSTVKFEHLVEELAINDQNVSKQLCRHTQLIEQIFDLPTWNLSFGRNCQVKFDISESTTGQFHAFISPY